MKSEHVQAYLLNSLKLEAMAPRELLSALELIRRKGDPNSDEVRDHAWRIMAELKRKTVSYSTPEEIAELGARVAGRALGARDGPSGPVPRRIVQYWDPLPPPEEVTLLQASWLAVNQGYSYRLLSRHDVEVLLDERGDERLRAGFEGLWHPVDRADVARLLDLWAHGGTYVDSDHEAVLPIEWLVDQHVDGVFLRRANRENRVVNGFFSTTINSPILDRALNIVAAEMERRGGRPPKLPGLAASRRFLEQAINGWARSEATCGGLIQWIPVNVAFQSVQVVHNGLPYKDRHWSRASVEKP